MCGIRNAYCWTNIRFRKGYMEVIELDEYKFSKEPGCKNRTLARYKRISRLLNTTIYFGTSKISFVISVRKSPRIEQLGSPPEGFP